MRIRMHWFLRDIILRKMIRRWTTGRSHGLLVRSNVSDAGSRKHPRKSDKELRVLRDDFCSESYSDGKPTDVSRRKPDSRQLTMEKDAETSPITAIPRMCSAGCWQWPR